MDVAGRRIVGLSRGVWESKPGPVLLGIAGDTWNYCDVYVHLDDGRALLVVPGCVRVESEPPSQVSESDFGGSKVSGVLGATVEDIVDMEEPSVLVILGGGRYLESSLMPGGTSVRHGSFASWTATELEDDCHSLVTGRRGAIREFVESIEK